MTGEVDSEVSLGSGRGCEGRSLRARYDRGPSGAREPSPKDYNSRRAPLPDPWNGEGGRGLGLARVSSWRLPALGP